MKLKIIVLLVIAAALAIAGARAAWKWQAPVKHANAPYKVAGWSWSDGISVSAEL